MYGSCLGWGWLVLDVYSAEGLFEKQVALSGNHDGANDSLTLLPDGRAVVVTGALEAWLNRMGAIDENADEESDTSPLEIICYQMDF